MAADTAQEPRWLERFVVDVMHHDMITTHGGLPGLRDEQLLESALARPTQRWNYEEDSEISSLAAAYGYGLARNHPYQDGNKRIAFVAMAVFTELNGFVLEAAEADVVDVMLKLAAGLISEEELAEWLRSHLSPAEDSHSV
jgi:death-on-curing protein